MFLCWLPARPAGGRPPTVKQNAQGLSLGPLRVLCRWLSVAVSVFPALFFFSPPLLLLPPVSLFDPIRGRAEKGLVVGEDRSCF